MDRKKEVSGRHLTVLGHKPISLNVWVMKYCGFDEVYYTLRHNKNAADLPRHI